MNYVKSNKFYLFTTNILKLLCVCDAWPVRRQTYGYLPSRKASPSIGRYQIILLGDRDTCVLTTCPGLHSRAERPGFELATCWSQVQRPNHSATESHILTHTSINNNNNKLSFVCRKPKLQVHRYKIQVIMVSAEWWWRYDVAEVNAGLAARKWQRTARFMVSVTCVLTAKDRLRNRTLLLSTAPGQCWGRLRRFIGSPIRNAVLLFTNTGYHDFDHFHV